jgi:hypothetical protein
MHSRTSLTCGPLPAKLISGKSDSSVEFAARAIPAHGRQLFQESMIIPVSWAYGCPAITFLLYRFHAETEMKCFDALNSIEFIERET